MHHTRASQSTPLGPGQLIRRYLAAVESYVGRRADHHHADDVVNEVFLRALRGIKGFDGPGPSLARLLAIARNVLRELRRERRRRPESFEDCPDSRVALVDWQEPWQMLERREEAAAARELLFSLAPRHRRVLLARYADGKSPAEIAASWGQTPQQISVLLHRARLALRSSGVR